MAVSVEQVVATFPRTPALCSMPKCYTRQGPA
jgi:hypothetical protein